MGKTSNRQLAAILFSDVVGYTAMMHEDEQLGLKKIQRYKEVLKEKVGLHRGDILNDYGDGNLCSFSSAINAITCAKEIQETLTDGLKVPLRIGIHIGDIVSQEGNIYGDGVNIASRVESLGIPGAVLFTNSLRQHLKSHPEFITRSLGKFHFKNVKEPIEVFALANDGFPIPRRKDMKGKLQTKPSSLQPIVKQMLLTFGLLGTFLVLISLFSSYWPGHKTEGEGIFNNSPNKSIAVLPFRNTGNNPDEEFFSDGIMDDILANLQRIEGLKVISRTSVMQYKNHNKSLEEIGEELSVNFVLEGSVRRNKNLVIISPQLNNTRTDEQVWADRFEREFSTSNIFDIQAIIANEIVENLQVSISPEAQALMDKIPTKSLAAYEYYKKGNYAIDSRTSNEMDRFKQVFEHYQNAIEIDPDFALAYKALSKTHRILHWLKYDPYTDHATLSNEYLKKALALDPKDPEILLEEGWNYYQVKGEYVKALEVVNRAKFLLPNSSDLYFALAVIHRRLGNWDLASKNIQKCLDLSPVFRPGLLDAGTTFCLMRQYERGQSYYDRLIQIDSNFVHAFAYKAYYYFHTGEYDKGIKLAKLRKLEESRFFQFAHLRLLIAKGDYEKALTILDQFEGDIFYEGISFFVPKYYFKALISHLQGDSTKVREYAGMVRETLEKRLLQTPDDYRIIGSLAKTYAFLGQKDLAIEQGEKGMELMPMDKDAIRGIHRLLDMAKVYVLVGEYQKAIYALDHILSIPSSFSVYALEHYPFWTPLHGLPEYQELIQEYKEQRPI